MIALLAPLWLPSGEDAVLADVRAVLQRRPADDVRDASELAAGLCALGADAVPVLYGLTRGEGLERLIGAAWEPERWACGPEQISELALSALGRAPSRAVFEELRAALEGSPGFQERVVALRILAAQAKAEGLELLFANALALGDLECRRPSVQRDLQASLAAILRHDERAWPEIGKRLSTLEPALAVATLEAVALSERTRGMALLEEALERMPHMADAILEAMVDLELARPWGLTGRSLAWLQPALEGTDRAARERAIRLVGRLRAREAAPALVRLLGDPEAGPSARRALKLMAGTDLGPLAETWEHWHEGELSWREKRFEILLDTLVARDPGRANQALVELLEHPLFHDEAAAELAEALPQVPRAVALNACTELERLGSRWAVPGLVQSLSLGKAVLAARAERALLTLLREPPAELAPTPLRAELEL